MKTIVLLHGLASSARSAKGQYLACKLETYPHVEFRAFDFNPTPKDFEYMTVTGMIDRLRHYLWSRRPEEVSLIGSSMGALVGLNYAHRYGGVSKMLLLAPALAYSAGNLSDEERERWEREGVILVPHYGFDREVPLRYDFLLDGGRYGVPVPPAAPTLIIHGRHDDVIAIGKSREYAARYGQVRLVEVDSDHRLGDQLPFIWDQVRLFLLA
jgi:pimeloyl-ACP methyl ester carboxylesterase